MKDDRDLLDLIMEGEDIEILCEWFDREEVDYNKQDLARQYKMIQSGVEL